MGIPSSSKSSVLSPGNAPPVCSMIGAAVVPAGTSSQSGRPDDRHARVARERGVGAAGRHARIRVRHGPAEPAVLDRDREVGHPRHEAVAVGRAAVEGRARVAVGPLGADVVDVLDDAVGQQPARPLHLLVLGVVEDRAVVHRVPQVGLDLARAGRVLREDRDAADAAVDEPLGDRRVLARDQVMPVEVLRVLAHVHDVRERLRVARVVDVLDAHDRQVVVGVRPREADRRPVLAPAGAHRVLVELVEVAGRAADTHGVHVVQRLHDGRDVLLHVVVEEAEVEDVLERPDAPVEGRVRGRRVVVRDREGEVALVDHAARLLVEHLGRTPPERVLRDVVIVREERDVVPVALDDERAHALARLDAVGGLVLDLLDVRIDVAVAAVARRGVLARPSCRRGRCRPAPPRRRAPAQPEAGAAETTAIAVVTRTRTTRFTTSPTFWRASACARQRRLRFGFFAAAASGSDVGAAPSGRPP